MLSVILLLQVSLKNSTSFKDLQNADYIDLMLTNSSNSFQNSCAIESVLFDFHKITETILKIKFQKLKRRTEHYKDYETKTLSNDNFTQY